MTIRGVRPAALKSAAAAGAWRALVSIKQVTGRRQPARRPGGDAAQHVEPVRAAVEGEPGSWSRASGGMRAMAADGT